VLLQEFLQKPDIGLRATARQFIPVVRLLLEVAGQDLDLTLPTNKFGGFSGD
jgi:hypothetical protein